jgi:thioredoxin-dependent peroxiredoxin
VIFGVSRDTPEVLAGFKKTHNITYSFLSDPDGNVAKALGIAPGARNTAVISKDGKLQKVYTKVDVGAHATEILKDLAAEKK